MNTPELGRTPALGFSTAILIALGWAVGWTIDWLVLTIPDVGDFLRGQGAGAPVAVGVLAMLAFGGALSWLIGGFIFAIILRKSRLLSKGKSATWIALGWAIGWVIGAGILLAFLLSGRFQGNGVDPGSGLIPVVCAAGIALAFSGGVGGYVTARVLKTERGHFQRRRTLSLVVSWSIMSAMTGATGLAVGGILTWFQPASGPITGLMTPILVGAIMVALISLFGASGMMAEIRKEIQTP